MYHQVDAGKALLPRSCIDEENFEGVGERKTTEQRPLEAVETCFSDVAGRDPDHSRGRAVYLS